MIELAAKEQIGNILDNKVLVALLRDKKYVVDSHTWIELEGNLDFSLSYEDERIVLSILSIKPRITAKRFLKFQGRISKLRIGKNDILVEIDNLPDQTITLV